MRSSRSLPLLLPAALFLTFGFAACHNNDTTTAPGAIASLTISAPNSSTAGQSFTIDVNATAIGVNGVHNGHVNVTVPAPLTVMGVNASGGTSATFTSGSASWNLGTLDSNSNATLHVTVTSTLPAGSSGQSVTVTASMTADGINAGDLVSTDSVQINP
jgi:hypothetical protein